MTSPIGLWQRCSVSMNSAIVTFCQMRSNVKISLQKTAILALVMVYGMKGKKWKSYLTDRNVCYLHFWHGRNEATVAPTTTANSVHKCSKVSSSFIRCLNRQNAKCLSDVSLFTLDMARDFHQVSWRHLTSVCCHVFKVWSGGWWWNQKKQKDLCSCQKLWKFTTWKKKETSRVQKNRSHGWGFFCVWSVSMGGW